MNAKPTPAQVKRYNRAVDRMFKEMDRFNAESVSCGIPLHRVVYTVFELGLRTIKITNRRNKK